MLAVPNPYTVMEHYSVLLKYRKEGFMEDVIFFSEIIIRVASGLPDKVNYSVNTNMNTY